MRACARALVALGLLCPAALPASETITYTYDARGRLIQVARSGSVNNGVTSAYQYDAADNRTAVTVTGAAPGATSFAVSDASGPEGSAIQFTVTRSGSTSSSHSVSYASAGGSATPGSDFVAVSGTLDFIPGEASKIVSVTALQDSFYESDENFSLNLSAPTNGATLSRGTGVGTITDSGQLILYAGQSIWSADGRFQLIMQTDGNLVLYGPDGYMWATGTNGGSDRWMVMQSDGNLVVYNGANQALWHTGTQHAGARLVLQNDGNLVIFNTANAPIWQTSTVYQPPAFAINDASATEGSGLTFTVTRSKATTQTYTVNYATANGSAVAGSDYTAASGTLSFAPSESSKTITIATIDDSLVEGNETLTVNLSAASGGSTISDAQGVGTIIDNDTAPPASFAVSDSWNYEGQPIVFTVSRNGDTSTTVGVSYATAHGTATGLDYTPVSGTLTFTAGQTSQTVAVQTRNDQVIEDTEEFYFNLSNPTGGATISDGQGIGTLYDNGEGPCPNCFAPASEPEPEPESPTGPGGLN